MNLFLSTCPICQKSKGGINPVNHAKCSRELQQLNADKKSKVPEKLTAKRGGSFAGFILRTAV